MRRRYLATVRRMRTGSLVISAAIVWSACSHEQPTVTAPQTQALPDAVSRRIPGQYIVVLSDQVQDVDRFSAVLAAKYHGLIKYVYRAALRGFAINISDEAANAVSAEPGVVYVEPDQEVHAFNGQPSTTWGLQRVSQYLSLPPGSDPLAYTYTYTYFADGTGVTEYTMDTGIETSHSDFGGRATIGFDALGGDGIDCNGHGTHVSGTVGGTMWGVAKNVHLVAVRVLDCSGSGTESGVIAGVDWVTANRVLPAVANMSFGGPLSSSVNQAVENSIAAGVTYVVAAGNSSTDACNVSPASAPDAITVGATDIYDDFASFSNRGTCVKINAPGVGITSDWLNGGTRVDTGTSMASPHVAGMSALFLSVNTSATPAQVRSALLADAGNGFLFAVPANTPNLMAYSRFIGASVTASGGTDTASACASNPVYACRATVAAVSASGGNTLTVWYIPAPGTRAPCGNVVGSFCKATVTLSGTTASGGTDTASACASNPFYACQATVAAVSASGGNTLTVWYIPARGTQAPCGNVVGSFCKATITLSSTTASGGTDTTSACAHSGFGGAWVCNATVAAFSASGSNDIAAWYLPAHGTPAPCRNVVPLGSFCDAFTYMPN